MKRFIALLAALFLAVCLLFPSSVHASAVTAQSIADVEFAGVSGGHSQHQGFDVLNQTAPLLLVGQYGVDVANSDTWVDVLHFGPKKNVNLQQDHGEMRLVLNNIVNGVAKQQEVTTPFAPPLGVALSYSLSVTPNLITGCFSTTCLSMVPEFPEPTGGNIIFYGNNSFRGCWMNNLLSY